MEDFIYFLREYPFVAILVVFFILRKIFGGGSEEKKVKEKEKAARTAMLKAQTTMEVEEARQRNQERKSQARQQKKARKEGGLSGESFVEQIRRQIEEATQDVENARRGQLSSGDSLSLSRPEARMSGPSDAETAAGNIRNTELFSEPTQVLGRRVEESTTDYDRDDHGFAYHSAGNRIADERPEDVLWHLKKQASASGTYGFRSAGQLPEDIAYRRNQRKYVSGSRIEAPTVTIREERKEPEPIRVNELFSDTDALTRMFILQEVMGPPRGRRQHGTGGMRPR